MLKQQVSEKQHQYEALRLHRTNDANNPVSDLAWSQSIQQIVEHIETLATERISASRIVIRNIGREETLSTSTETGSRSITTPTVPEPLPPTLHATDGLAYPLGSRVLEQGIRVPPNLSDISGDDAMEVESDIVDVVSEEPAVSGRSGLDVSTTAVYLSRSTSVSNTSLQQESEQLVGQSRGGPSTRYRLLTRKGKPVPKEWQDSRDDTDSSASDSE